MKAFIEELGRLFKESVYFQLQVFMLVPLAVAWGAMPWWVFFAPSIAGVLHSVVYLVIALIEWNAKP